VSTPADSEQTASSGAGPALLRLLRTQHELRDQLREIRERRHVLEGARADTQAEIAALEGRAAAKRVQLRFQIEDAETRMAAWDEDTPNYDQAWNAAREARRELADVEAEVAEAMPMLSARRDSTEVEVERLRLVEATLADELASTESAIRKLEADEQAERARDIETQLADLEPVVREAAGSGIADLSHDYTSQATRHAAAWKIWGGMLILTILAAVIGSLVLFSSERIPTGVIDSETVVTIARNLLIVGLLLYVVRLASLQFRVHRHLEAVAHNKAAALSTFNRIVGVSGDPEVRNAIAAVLAQAVFSSEETGFVDGSDNHITLVERIAAGFPRASAP
jgi:hypothetical protein